MENDFLESFDVFGTITPDGPDFNGTISGTNGVGESVWISIDYVAGQIIDLDATGFLIVYDAQGNIVDQSQATRGGFSDDNLFLEGLETGTYYVEFRYNVRQGDGPIALSATEVFDDFEEDAPTAITANGPEIAGRIDFQGDVDSFQIDAVAGQTLTLTLTRPAGDGPINETSLSLADANGNFIDIIQDPVEPSLDTRVYTFTPTESGPLILNLRYDGSPFGEAVTTYGLTVETASSINIIDGTSAADHIRGTAQADDIVGLEGDDVIDGLGGNDVLSGGGGEDLVRGGSGDDDIFGGANDDDLRGGSGNDYIEGGSGSDLIFGQNGADVLLGGTGNDVMRGGHGDDTLRGESGNDKLFGQNGNDLIDGGAGADLLNGGAGADDLYGGAAADRLIGGNGQDLMFGGTGNDALSGGNQDDVMNGGAGADKLFGGDGDDVLSGGQGNDLLVGGEGADTFVFASDGGHDRIRDFDIHEDSIVIQTSEGLLDFEDFAAMAQQSGNNVVFDNGEGLRIVLQNVDLHELNADMFSFEASVDDYAYF